MYLNFERVNQKMSKTVWTFIAAIFIIGTCTCVAWAGSDFETDNYITDNNNGLNLSLEQQQKIMVIRQQFENDTLSIKNDLRVKEKELRLLWAADPLNQSAIDNKTKEVNSLRIQLITKRRAMFAQMKAILTPEQLAKIKFYAKRHLFRRPGTPNSND